MLLGFLLIATPATSIQAQELPVYEQKVTPVLAQGQFNYLPPVSEPIPVTSAQKETEVSQSDIPLVMQEIARCESGNRQFNDDGSVLRGVINSKDVGRFQINEYYHLEQSKKLGMDIYTWDGNTEYAMWLYENKGTIPWNWSKKCWGLSTVF